LLVVYDGVCRLCDGLVAFLIRRDPDASRFRFVALQSGEGRAVLAAHGISEEDALRSFTVIVGGASATAPFTAADARMWRKSSGALMLATRLALPYRALGCVGWVVPLAVRDALYDCLAARRYRWFGKLSGRGTGGAAIAEGDEDGAGAGCLLPTPRNLARFLDADEIRAEAAARREAARARVDETLQADDGAAAADRDGKPRHRFAREV
jgi:predicted DCC family thiol-disulfide oxidoreductase YuxK